MPYRLTLFGPPALVDEAGATPPGLGPGKPLAVLCYLAREGEVRRETVTALLWGETGESKARNAFRQALHRLRSALGAEVVPHDPDTVRIAMAADLWVDVSEFERALSEGRSEDAVELVRGDFLEGFAVGEAGFDHWADGERAHLRGRYLSALRAAATGALAEGRIDEATPFARRLAEEEPLDSAAAVLEAKTLTAAGRGDEGRRSLAAHAERYREQVGDEPPEEVARALEGLAESAWESGPEEEAGIRAGDLVLRPEALEQLVGAWRRAVDGGAEVVLLEGKAGSGKTWLVDELVRRVRPVDRPLVLRGTERMGPHGLPFAAVAEALRDVRRARGLAGASTHLLAEAARLLPELRDRFDLPPLEPITDRMDRLRFFEGVASVLDAVAYEQPVLLVLEGLDHADEDTIELVHFLVSRLGDSAVLFVLAFEPGPTAAELDRRLGDRAIELVLGPVQADRLSALLERDGGGVDANERERIVEAAEGNPRRARELAERSSRGESLAAPPARREDILRSRIAGLGPRDRRLLVVLALVGRPLSVRRLAAATHLPEPAVLESAASLRRQGLVREREPGVEIPDELIAALALEATGPAGRGLLAGWTGEALAAERAANDAELAELARMAGRMEEAARYAEAAGRTSARVGAQEEAAAHFRRALEWTEDPAMRARLERILAGVGDGPKWLSSGEEGVSEGGEGRAVRPLVRSRLGLLTTAVAAVLVLIMLGVLEVPWVGERQTPPRRVVRDTLVLVRTDPDGNRTRLGFTGNPVTALERRPLQLGNTSLPAWVDSLALAGTSPILGPDGRVAIGAPGGLLIVTGDRIDTLIASGGRQRLVPMDWAPDGSGLIYRRSRPADRGSTLWTTPVNGGEPVPIDTEGRVVEAAAWSPDGTRVAWTAHPPGERARDVFVAFIDGTAVRNLTDHPADDYHVVWAPGGDRVAFTSDREGNAEIFAKELLSGRLWRLTWNDAQDDEPAFSPDGEYLAFESTRGGEAAIYVVSSWGGQPVRVSGEGQRVVHAGWRGYPPPHLSHLRFEILPALEVGEVGRVVVEPVYSDYVPRSPESIRWSALDPEIVALTPEGREPEVSGAVADTFVVGRAHGLGRVVASAGGWRVDTVLIKVGEQPIRLPVGAADRNLPISYGLSVSGRLLPGDGPRRVSIAGPRAALEDGENGLGLAGIEWVPGEGRITFQVEREQHTEAIEGGVGAGGLPFTFVVGDDGRVRFSVAGSVRWRSTLRVTGAGLPVHRVRLRADPALRGPESAVEGLEVVVGG